MRQAVSVGKGREEVGLASRRQLFPDLGSVLKFRTLPGPATTRQSAGWKNLYDHLRDVFQQIRRFDIEGTRQFHNI